MSERCNGWEAGIRTPIPWSRATCPTVGRPPSARCEARRLRELLIIAQSELEPARARALGRTLRQLFVPRRRHVLIAHHPVAAGFARGLTRRFRRLLLLLAAMARHPALASRFARFLAGPLVGRALLMRCLAALAGDLPLLLPVHRRKTAILFGHRLLPPGRMSVSGYPHVLVLANTRAATAVPRARV